MVKVDFSDETFGRRLKEARQQAGLRQQDVADRMAGIGRPMHRSAVAKIEAGERPATITEAFYLAAIMQITLVDLFRDDQEEFDSVVAAQKEQLYVRRLEVMLRMRRLEKDMEDHVYTREKATHLLASTEQWHQEALNELKAIEMALSQLEER